MLSIVKRTWNALKDSPPGERFEKFHREQQKQTLAVRVSYIALAVVAFGIGVVLAFIPGPAVVFFGLSAALVAAQSAVVARLLDKGELKATPYFESLRAWWRRRRGGSRKSRKTRQATSSG